MDNRNGGHLLSSGSTAEDEHTFHEQASNRERELQKQLDAAKSELEQERERMWAKEEELRNTLSSIEQEVCEYKGQLVLVKMGMEAENREWESMMGRLETQVERERLNVRSRDVEIHQLRLAKEQETAMLNSRLVTVRTELEAENRSLREQLRQLATRKLDTHMSH